MFDNSSMDSRESVSRIITMAIGYKILDVIEDLEKLESTIAWFEDGYIKFVSNYYAETFREYVENLGGKEFITTSLFSGKFKI